MKFSSVLNTKELLDHLSKEQSRDLSAVMTKTSYAKDQVIFYENAMPFGVYLLEAGKVKLYKTGSEGKNQIFQICTSGDFFGFHAVLNNSVYPDSAATLEDSTVQFIPKQNFIDLIKASSSVSFHLLQQMSKEFQHFIDQETMLAQKPVRQRVADVLLSLYQIYSEDDQIIPLSRTDLADMSGTVKETLVRVLRTFKDEKIIRSTNGRDIEVLNPGLLKQVSDS